MRKRILIFLLAALFVLSGCSRQVVSVLSDNGETASEIISQSISSDASSDSSEASSYGSSSLPISSRAAKSTASSKASASVSSNRSGIVAAPTVAEEKDTPLPTPEVETTTTPVTQVQTTHTAITQSSYYGYARLNTVEKALYNRLNTAVQATTNLINLSEAGCIIELQMKLSFAMFRRCWLTLSLIFRSISGFTNMSFPM